MEYLNRGVYAVNAGGSVFISWRSLEEDPIGCGFNVYRWTDGETVKLNDTPIYGGTNFTDTTADMTKDNSYYVTMVVNGKEEYTDGEFVLKAGGSVYTKGNAGAAQVIPIKSGGTIHFVWVGDYDGDGAYDYLVDRSADDHQKLETYKSDGTYLWTLDLGVNSENKNNISPGASTIDVGMWDGATVYDMDCDGYAEVLVRIADGVTFGDGKKYSSNSGGNGQAIAVLDGRTGKLKASVNLPQDYMNIGPMACMMEIGYLDGVNPALVCWIKSRNSDKSFNSIMVTYGYAGGNTFKQLWKYDASKYGGGGEAHQIRVADVDYNGKDEVLHMGYALNSDGTLRYQVPEVVHGDRWFTGSFSPANDGKEMYCYGVQQRNPSTLLEFMYNASTGKMLWTNYGGDGNVDIGRGNVGDFDPNYAGFESYSFQGMLDLKGNKLYDCDMYPSIRLWWDGDLLAESYNDSKIEKWNYENKTTSRLATTWKISECASSDRGAPMFYGDILGDWREEIICTGYNYDSLVIISTTAPTEYRNECLAQDPCYRNCMTAKGYYQSHMLDYYLGSDMKRNDPIAPIDGKLVKQLTVTDLAHNTGWGLAENAAVGSVIYGDREFTYTELSDKLTGAEIIRTACDSKKTDADLAAFTAGSDITAYVLLDKRVITPPQWLNDWTKTDLTAAASNDVNYVIYSKDYAEGENIILGTNGMSGNCVNYAVLVKEQSAEPIKGDVNMDGLFDTADVELLQKWLLAVPNTHLADWKAADFCENDKLDVFDLCMMKLELPEKS